MFFFHILALATWSASFMAIISDESVRSHGTALSIWLTFPILYFVLISILQAVVAIKNSLVLIHNMIHQSNEISVNTLNVINQEFYNVNESLNRINQQPPVGSTNP